MKGGSFHDRNAPLPRWRAVLLGVAPLALLVGVWWFLTRGAPEERIVPDIILPAPRDVIAFVPTLLGSKDAETGHSLLGHAALSFRRVGLAFLVALLVALPLGTLVAAFRTWRATFSFSVTAAGYVPIAALVPLSMSWWGTGEQQKVLFLALAFCVYLLPLVIRALDSVDDVYVRTAYTLGASRWQVIKDVLLRVAAPDIWHAMRLAFGVGWSYLVLVEIVVLSGGLGGLIFIGQRRYEVRPQIYLVLILITLIAWVVDLAWVRAGRRLFPYRQERE